MTFIRFVNKTSKDSKYIGFQIKEHKGMIECQRLKYKYPYGWTLRSLFGYLIIL